MSVQLEVTTENLLNAIVRMPEGEFNRFVANAKRLRKRGPRVSGKEADLLHKINTLFPPDRRLRYNDLYARFKEDDLSEKEYVELTKLSDEFEMLNVKRLEYIGKLAELRGQTLLEVIDHFELKPKE